MKTVLKDHFVPHAGNEYMPHSLQKAAVVAMMFLVLLSFTLANFQALFWISSDWMISTILPAVIVQETNEERQVLDEPALVRNTTLDYAAQLKAEHMAENQYFAHYSPDGISPWYWFGQAEYGFVHAGENLAIHFSDSSEVVDAWMDSPTHRANILNDDFTEIGIGIAEGTFEGYRTVYVVQLFGTPAARVAAAAPEPVPTPTPVVAAATSEPEPVSEPTVVAVAPREEPAPVELAPEPTAEPESVQVAGAEDEVVAVIEREALPAPEPEPETATATDDITEIVVEDTGVVAYSDMISTSTGGVPATVGPDAHAGSTDKTFFAFATQPQFVLQLMYATIGMFVVLALLLSILIEIRRQHPLQVAYGAGLLATMWVLLYIHMAVTSGATIV